MAASPISPEEKRSSSAERVRKVAGKVIVAIMVKIVCMAIDHISGRHGLL